MTKIKLTKTAKILLIVLAVITALTIAMFVWMSIYYPADTTANTLLENADNITVYDDYLVINGSTTATTAIIFYPGAKVEYTAYLPLLYSIATQCDVMVILVEMPFNMAFFGINRADDIINTYTYIDSWYMMGHSLGGAMASSYASKNTDTIDGLIVLGSYVYGDYPTSQSLTIYGSLNDQSSKIDYTDNIVVIEGGNHAQFGNYGIQAGDEVATITATEQQAQTVTAVYEFLYTYMPTLW